jgi:hypothetical protein
MKTPRLLIALALSGPLFALTPLLHAQNTQTPASPAQEPTPPAQEATRPKPAGSVPGIAQTGIEQTVNVITSAPVVQTDDAITTTFFRDFIQSTPGAYQDIPRFLQTLPGVTYDTDARNTYLVNGGNPLENLYVVDGVEVPNINHISTSNTSGGFVSMIDSDDVASIKLHKMLYGPQYSGALSSVLEIKTRDVDRLGLHGDVSVGYAGADIVVDHPIGRLGATVTEFRKSVVNFFTDDIGIDGVPKYWSVLSKDIFSLSDHDVISILFLTGDDSLDIAPNLQDAQDPTFLNTYYTGNRLTAAATWEHRFSEKTIQRLQFAYSRIQSTSRQTDPKKNNALVDSDKLDDSPVNAKYDVTTSFKHLDIRAGAVGGVHGIGYQIQQPNGFPSPYTLDPTPVNATNVNYQLQPKDYAGYGTVSYQSKDGFLVSAGGRFQKFGLTESKIFSPQFTIRTPTYKSFFLFGGAASYAQLPPLPTILSIPSNLQLKPITVNQFQVGLHRQSDNGSRFSISVYQKNYHSYPVSSAYAALSLADVVDPFGQPFIYLALTSAGSGIATGGEIDYASNPSKRFFYQGNIARQQVTHKALDGISRRANFDVPILINGIAGYRFTENQRITARVGYHTGTPYTPFLITQSKAQDRLIYDTSLINTQRGSYYMRVDFRYQIDLHIHDRPLELYGGLDNAFNRQNFYQYVFIANCTAANCNNDAYALTQQGFLAEGGNTYLRAAPFAGEEVEKSCSCRLSKVCATSSPQHPFR